jgi:hypothetical protein
MRVRTFLSIRNLNLLERMELAVYLGLDEKNITAKFVAGTKVL